MEENPSYTFTYTILKNCRSRGVLLYSEVEILNWRKVLTSKLPDGEYEYFNKSIGGVKFRPKLGCSEETRAKLSKAKKGNTSRLGKRHSKETRVKLSKANKGRKLSEETYAKVCKAVRNMSDETRAKMSSSLRKDLKIYTFSKEGEVVSGTRYLLAEELELSDLGTSRIITGRYKTTKGWTLVETK